MSLDADKIKVLVKKAVAEHFAIRNSGYIKDLHGVVLELIEVPLLQTVLTLTKNNKSEAAKWLGISRKTILTRIRLYGLNEYL